MAEAIFLGTGTALPSPEQENTYFVIKGRAHTCLIDCGGSPYSRLLKAGLEPLQVDTVVITHFHPDHVYGLPSLLLTLWLAGRRAPLEIYGLADTLSKISSLIEPFEPMSWPEMFEIRLRPFETADDALVFQNEDFGVTAALGRHFVPSAGLRILNRHTGGVLAYSSDTEPCRNIVRLAQGAQLLFHEASGGPDGHSSAAQAGEVARAAGVKALVIVHYDARTSSIDSLIEDARKFFMGPVSVAKDFDRYVW